MAYYNGPTGFEKVNDVINIQQEMMNLFTGNTIHNKPITSAKSFASEVLSVEKQKLQDLRKYYKGLYDTSLAQSGLTSKGLTELYKCLQEWNGKLQLSEFLANKKLLHNLTAMAGTIKNWSSFVRLLEDNIKINDVADLDMIGEVVAAGVEAGFASMDGKKNGNTTISVQTTDRSSGRYLKFFNSKGETVGSLTIDVSQEGDITRIRPYWKDSALSKGNAKSKLFDTVLTTAKSVFPNVEITAQSSQDPKVTELITHTLDGININPLVKFYITEALKEKYKYGASLSINKGFLGEVYWYAFALWIKSMGLIKNTAVIGAKHFQGVEPPVDVLFSELLGVQVKNYSETSDGVVHVIRGGNAKKVARRERDSAEYFFSHTLGLNTNVLNKFYFSYSYNQVLDDESAERIYRPVYGRFELIDKGFRDSYIGARLDAFLNFHQSTYENIVEQVSEDFNVSSEIINRPVFYAFNNKLLPTYVLIDALMTSLDNVGKGGNNAVEVHLKDFEFNALGVSNVYPESADYTNVLTGSVYYNLEIDASSLFNTVATQLGAIPIENAITNK